MSDSFQLAPGTVLGRYRIVSEIGRGNNGIVYLAHQDMLDRQVACKVLLPEYANDKKYTTGFFREARIAAKISHPNVVQALDVGAINGVCFFIMEYVEGEMLEKIRKKAPEKLTPSFILHIAIQLAEALDYAWRCNKMIHGDIKPENILIRPDGEVKLADLGVARIAGTATHNELMATPLYVAPELLTDGAGTPDPRSDIYSFGVMLYELCSGEAPFKGKMEELLEHHINTLPEPLLRRNPDMNISMAALVDRMLAKSPAERPQSWQEIVETLKNIQQSELSTVQTTIAAPAPADAAEPGPGKISVVIAILAVLAGILIGLLMIRFAKPQNETIDDGDVEALTLELKQNK